MLSISCAVPDPTVVIEEVGAPYSGFEYTLSCIVTVNDTVGTAANIYSVWQLPENVTEGISTSVQNTDNLHQILNSTFQPPHEGNYVCGVIVFTTADGLSENSKAENLL